MVQLQQAADARAAAQSRVRLELLTELVRKDLKVKYKNSALGFIWSLANPLLLPGRVHPGVHRSS